MRDCQYEGLALSVPACDGLKIAVGGICRKGYVSYWRRRFQELKQLRMHPAYDIYDVDLMLAQALASLSTDSLLLTGASAYAPGLAKTAGLSTGGVLGDPRQESSSAKDDCQQLSQDFAMYSAAGGPGLAAIADFATLRELAHRGKEDFLYFGGRNWPALLRQYQVDTGILVLDGTGTGTGCLSVFCQDYLETILIEKAV
ncbi:MAG: hypothetical protein AAGU12_03370 [Clostridiales bacterium]